MSRLSLFLRSPLGQMLKPLAIQYALAKANKVSGGKLEKAATVINNPGITGSLEKNAIGSIFGIASGGINEDGI